MSVLRKQGVLQGTTDCCETYQGHLMHQARFCFSFHSIKEAEIVARSLTPEITHKIPKSMVTITVEKTLVTLTVGSDDVDSLRAACNSYLRWIQTALSVRSLM